MSSLQLAKAILAAAAARLGPHRQPATEKLHDFGQVAMQTLKILGMGAIRAACIGPVSWASGFALSSPDVKNGAIVPMQQVFDAAGCSGQNMSPELDWSQAPPATKAYAITVFDQNANAGKGFWHWVVFDIPAAVTSLPPDAGDAASNILPASSVQIQNDYGIIGYGGPCPPAGETHRYVFTVYALDVAALPDLTAAAAPADVAIALRAHSLADARIVAVYP